ncbi:hypothetical protein GIB67_005696 [Kingdonia uniflora]|uniref:Uncharacterized protein n=1 Tax=Kingdonia uniflora TaxID=39325 RepID=A0A7J7NII5_9MAGN|nr:hypothetical protein GIB67_005696 [Kingdonia uniflora]
MSGGTTHIITGVTTVDCQKQVRSWRLLLSIMEFLIPRCNRNYLNEQKQREEDNYVKNIYRDTQQLAFSPNTKKITGTIFGYRHGKVSFCIQANSTAVAPILLLELDVPTAILAKEMQSGVLRISLDSKRSNSPASSPLISIPFWTMSFNGKKVGFAIKRKPTQVDMQILRLMKSVAVGAGVISGKRLSFDDDLMYLRANFERVASSSNSESFHLINPDGCTSQELNIVLRRTR